jgi:hypothetical protein
MSPIPRPLSDFAQNRYLAYPHCNGFADGGAGLILGQIEEKSVSLWKYNLASGREVQLGLFPIAKEPPNKLFWFDVAFNVNQMIAVVDQSIWLFDLARPGTSREVYRAPRPHRLNSIPSITADGRQAVIGLHDDAGLHRALHLDLKTGAERVLFEHTWLANHFHFSPFDSNWIGYCHEGPALDISDRVWGWHPEHAPRGRCLFQQTSDRPPQKLCLGHERWSFHAVSVIVPAFGVSPTGPCGLYELFTDGRPARLISPGERDWHCDVSRDGRWAVVDTTGPHDAPGRGWENASDISDILLVDMETGRREFVARSHQHRFHPRHPHPTFSPDAATLFYNEAESDGSNNRIMAIPNPWKNNP